MVRLDFSPGSTAVLEQWNRTERRTYDIWTLDSGLWDRLYLIFLFSFTLDSTAKWNRYHMHVVEF